MKKFAIVLLLLLLTVFSAPLLAQEKPNWIGKDCWVEGEFVFGVGKTPKMTNFSLQRSVAENRARTATLKALNLKNATLRGSEIVEVWQDTDGTIYVLARVPKSGIIPIKN